MTSLEPEDEKAQISQENLQIQQKYTEYLPAYYASQSIQVDEEKMRQELVSVGISEKTFQDQIINEIRRCKYPEIGNFKQNTAVETQEHMKQIPITCCFESKYKITINAKCDKFLTVLS